MQNLSVLNVRFASQLICTVMTIVASKNRGWLLLPIVYAFADQSGLSHLYANEFITHLEATPGMLVHIGPVAVLLRNADHCRALCHAAHWIDYQLKNKKLAFNR